MPMSFAKELQVLYQTRLEQTPALNDFYNGKRGFTVEETIDFLSDLVVILHDLVVRIGEKVDELESATNGG